jgi:diacylglycerol kinase (ATP)
MPDAAGAQRRPSFLRAVACAGAGLADAALRERNLRIHLVLGALAGCAAATLGLSSAERAVVLLCIGAVVAAETVNSALEVIVDAIFPGHDERARFAKDAAAGAVLAIVAASVLVGGAVLGPALVAALRAGEGRGELSRAVAGGAILALAVALLPLARSRAAHRRDVLLGLGGLALVTGSAVSPWGVLAAALLYILAARAGARILAGRGPPAHGPRVGPGA